MDLNDFWQENKRFVLSVVGAVVVFFIALNFIDGKFHKEAAKKRAEIERKKSDLAQPMFKPTDQTRAREQGEALDESLAKLAPAVEFRPREAFTPGSSEGSVSSLFFSVASDVREDLMQRAGRSNLRLPSDLGLPPAVVDEDEIERYLECLDVVDRVTRLAMEAGVERIDEIRMRLDPRLLAGRQLDTFETHSVEFEISGPPGPIVRLLAFTQEVRDGGPLLIDAVEMKTAPAKADEVRLMVTFQVVHLHGLAQLEEVEP